MYYYDKTKSHLTYGATTLFSRQRYEKKIKEKPIKMFFIDKNINIFYFATFPFWNIRVKA